MFLPHHQLTNRTKHEHNHPNIQQCAMRQGLSNRILTSLTLPKRKVKHYFTAVRTESRHGAPPETSTSSITHCWFYKASAIRDLIWLYYNGHQREGAINQIEEGETEQPPRKEMNWNGCCSFSVLLLPVRERVTQHPSYLKWSTILHQKTTLPCLKVAGMWFLDRLTGRQLETDMH